ncbi:cytochrome C oxidase subunit III [Alsobacter sp. KACC 23698]|uniref:Cytochrome C oxidase subunit III n=1 Tax=Alsobacter sp. KACC 23698 TaxID=3149229 RepID=A0AAU7JMN8_9HYPH
MKMRAVADLSGLPTYAFGSRSPIWWGTLGFVAIEGMGFALAVGSYLYLHHLNPQWPLSADPPNPWPGVILTLLLLASLWPNRLVDKAAHEENLAAVRRLSVIMSVMGLAAIGVRLWEFGVLHVRWDQNAYGSLTWLMLGLHATHLITDVGDTLVLTALMFTRHGQGKRFSDVSDNAFYWYFVVGAWLPIFLVVYGIPRW